MAANVITNSVVALLKHANEQRTRVFMVGHMDRDLRTLEYHGLATLEGGGGWVNVIVTDAGRAYLLANPLPEADGPSPPMP